MLRNVSLSEDDKKYINSIYTIKQIISVIILIPYIFLFLAYGFKASLQSLNHKFTFQLCLSSIFYSVSFLINRTEEGGLTIPFRCYIQGLMNIFGESCCILFTLAIAVITLISYKYSYVLKNNQKIITAINIIVWCFSIIFIIICSNHVGPDLTLVCWFKRDSTVLQVIYFTYLGLSFVGNMVILTYVKFLIRRDLIEESEIEKYPQYVKKINIQISAQIATYSLFLAWLIMDKFITLEGYGKILYFIAEVGECLTGILIPLAYGINQEIWDYFILIVTCNRKRNKNTDTERISELHLTREDVEEVKKISLIDASNIRNLSQFDEVDDDL